MSATQIHTEIDFDLPRGKQRGRLRGLSLAPYRSARNATLEELGRLHPSRYLPHDRDTICESFREVLKAGGVKTMSCRLG